MIVYEVVQSAIKGCSRGISLWSSRTDAEIESKKAALKLVQRNKTRTLEQDKFNNKWWNVMEVAEMASFHGRPEDPPILIAQYYVVEREVN